MNNTTTTGNAVFAFLDGKTFTLDGVHGTFEHELRQVRYPYARTEERLHHRASAAGRRSKVYQDSKRQLGDD
jgi:hypothetical protein